MNRAGLVLGAVGVGVVTAARATVRRRGAIDLRGRVVLITGGSRELGLLLAREFGREGARVVVCARDAGELARARRSRVARHRGVHARV